MVSVVLCMCALLMYLSSVEVSRHLTMQMACMASVRLVAQSAVVAGVHCRHPAVSSSGHRPVTSPLSEWLPDGYQAGYPSGPAA